MHKKARLILYHTKISNRTKYIDHTHSIWNIQNLHAKTIETRGIFKLNKMPSSIFIDIINYRLKLLYGAKDLANYANSETILARIVKFKKDIQNILNKEYKIHQIFTLKQRFGLN